MDDDIKPTKYMLFDVGPRYCLGVNMAHYIYWLWLRQRMRRTLGWG